MVSEGEGERGSARKGEMKRHRPKALGSCVDEVTGQSDLLARSVSEEFSLFPAWICVDPR